MVSGSLALQIKFGYLPLITFGRVHLSLAPNHFLLIPFDVNLNNPEGRGEMFGYMRVVRWNILLPS
jgi:hypothetical protein